MYISRLVGVFFVHAGAIALILGNVVTENNIVDKMGGDDTVKLLVVVRKMCWLYSTNCAITAGALGWN